MALSLQEVEHIAELARLTLSDEEKARFAEQLSACLDYFDSLQALQTDDVAPMTSTLPLDTVLREDVVEECLPRDRLLRNAPDVEQDMFRVNAVLD